VDSFGTPNTIAENAAAVANETPPYITTFKIGSLPSFSLEKKFAELSTPKYFQYTGCKANRMDMQINSDGIIDCSYGIIGSTLTVAANSFSKSGSDQDGFDLDFEHRAFESFELAAADVKVGGSAVAYIDNIKFSIENNLDGGVYVVGGAGTRQSLPAGLVRVSGMITCLFGDTAGADSMSLITDIIAATEKSIDLTFKRGNGAGGVDNESLQIVFNEILFARNSPIVRGATGLKVDLNFDAFYEDNADATTLKMILKRNSPPRL
jgi:hypothetical protein